MYAHSKINFKVFLSFQEIDHLFLELLFFLTKKVANPDIGIRRAAAHSGY